MDRTRVGVIGLGYGAKVLVPAFRRDGRCEVRVLCGRDPARTAAAAKAAGVPGWSTDWQGVAEDVALEALAVAVPPATQPEIALAAFGAGKHVFCEKPLAADALGADRLLEAAIRAGRAHAVDFELAETAAFGRAKALLESGRLGELRHAAVSWHVETRAHRGGPLTWKLAAKDGGGTLNSFGAHVFHYVEWLLGPVTRIAARLLPNASHDALGLTWLQLESGASVSVTVSANAPAASGHRLEVYGDAGSLVLENPSRDYARGFGLVLRNRDGVQERLTPEAEGPEDGRVEAAARLVARFLDAALGGPACRPGLEEGVRVQRLIDAARRADAAGSWVEA